jgi:hypothetical protein
MYGEGKTESTEQTQAPTESKTEETPAAPVTQTKEAEKETEKAAPVAEKEDVQETVDKAQASKAGTVGELAGGDKEDKGKDSIVGDLPMVETNSISAVLPESTVKETSLGAETYPSTTEASAEESATSTAATTGAAATTSLPEHPKTSESTGSAAVPPETDAAHIKRPYEKPIFSNDEVKPHKMAKTEEEQAAAEKNLAGAGPASTAAYTTPEPVPVVEAPKKAEEKVATETAPKTTTAESKPVESKTVESKPTDSKAPASPAAVAAASAAINNSKTDKAAESAEPKKPEAALKRGEEPQPRPDVPKKDTPAKDTPATESAQQEPAKADEAQTSETAEQPEKKKGGFFGWLKRKFK